LDPIPFDDFLRSLQAVGTVAALDPGICASIKEAVDALSALQEVNRVSLADLIRSHSSSLLEEKPGEWG